MEGREREGERMDSGGGSGEKTWADKAAKAHTCCASLSSPPGPAMPFPVECFGGVDKLSPAPPLIGLLFPPPFDSGSHDFGV